MRVCCEWHETLAALARLFPQQPQPQQLKLGLIPPLLPDRHHQTYSLNTGAARTNKEQNLKETTENITTIHIKRTALLWVIDAASSGISLLMFRDNLSVPTSRAICPMRPIGCPETSVRNYHCWLRNNPKGRSSNLRRGGSLKSPTIYNIHFLIFFSVFSLLTGNDAMNEMKRENLDEQRCKLFAPRCPYQSSGNITFSLWLQLLWLRLLPHTVISRIWYSRSQFDKKYTFWQCCNNMYAFRFLVPYLPTCFILLISTRRPGNSVEPYKKKNQNSWRHIATQR